MAEILTQEFAGFGAPMRKRRFEPQRSELRLVLPPARRAGGLAGRRAAPRGGESARVRRVVQLIAQHRASLLQYVTRIVSCEQDAEDVVQETCLRLLRVEELWDSDRQVRALLYKIATNLARDRLRRRKTRSSDAHLPFDSLELAGEEPQPEELVERDLEMRMLSRALSCLPARPQQAFTLHVNEHLSYRTIAQRLGVSTKTIERDMSMVLEFCQHRLAAGERT